jgi:hypothetical protein
MEIERIAEEAFKKEQGSIIVLTGEAPKQYNPEPVTINGNIDAPSRFVDGKNKEFEKSQRHCMVSKTDGKIVLILNEQSIVNRYTIQGRISIGKKFKALGINQDNVAYSPEELANKFKLLRAMFKNNMEHASICSTLRNLKAKVNRDIDNQDDRKGNVTTNFKQTVESNMPDAITLKLPLLEGEDPVEVEVNVVLETNGATDILCYLESIDAAEIIEKLFEQRVNQEVEKLKDFVTIIEC